MYNIQRIKKTAVTKHRRALLYTFLCNLINVQEYKGVARWSYEFVSIC